MEEVVNRSRLAIGVPTLGKSPRLRATIESLAAQTSANFDLFICVQGDLDAETVDLIRRLFAGRSSIVLDSDRGISKAKNQLLKVSKESASHILFLNDTSCLPNNFVESLEPELDNHDIVVVSYLDDGFRARYRLPAGNPQLSLKNVWKAIEPATVLRIDLAGAHGGFDERIGTGGPTWLQSGEGTDLLLRLLPEGVSCKWLPQLRVHGVAETYNLTFWRALKKTFFYGVGYGYLLRHYGYPFGFALRSWLGPFRPKRLMQKPLYFLGSVSSSLGRLVGWSFGRMLKGHQGK